MISHHHVKFNGNGHCGGGDIMVFVCHLSLQHHTPYGESGK